MLELGDRLLALAQDAEDHQSALMRQRLEEVARLLGLGSHDVEIGGSRFLPLRKGSRNLHDDDPLGGKRRGTISKREAVSKQRRSRNISNLRDAQAITQPARCVR